jgi:hypothetical protein
MRYVKPDGRTLANAWGAPLDDTRDIVEASIWCPETTHLSPSRRNLAP